MNRYKNFIFKINNDFYFKLTTARTCFKQLNYTDMVKVFFCASDRNSVVIFRGETIFTALLYFKEMSERLLSRKLIVHSKDIERGITYNQSFAYHTIKGYSDQAEHERYKWTFYSLFSNPDKNTAWLYEYNNEFYVEIAPLYCALPTNTEKKFARFMKDYKPKFVIKVSHPAVCKWYKKSSSMFEQLQKNHE